MPFVTALLIVAASAVEPNPETPSEFLKVESKAWSKWLDEKTDVSWHGVALKDVLADQFGPPALAVDPVNVLDTPITFDIRFTSRRTALWRLSQRYGFTIRWAQKDEPKVFMGLSESEHRDHNVGGRRMVEITQVMRSDYRSYQDWKQREQVTKEEVIDGILYYAIDVDRDVHFGGPQGLTAHVIEVQRYKTAVPPVEATDMLPTAPQGQTWKLVWQDEFDGTTLDASTWDIPEYKRRDGYWSRNAITLDGNGHLVMSVLKDGDKYLDGCVRTKGKFQHSFGYYVARIQLQKQQGHWSAFWIMGDGVGKVGDEGRDGTEIDIMKKPWLDDRLNYAVHWDGKAIIVEALGSGRTEACADLLFAELRRVKSSNTTRRYLAAVIKVLASLPAELIQDGFAELAADKSFSQKMRDKFRAVMASADGLGDEWF